jgi:RNA polymerase sigma-70 factor (ECF subfamily)
VAAALARLEHDHREIIELRIFQKLPYAEVAQRMGRSPGSVRQLWVRAVKKLRLELGDQG